MPALSGDTRVLFQLLRGLPRHGAHRDRLQVFYGPQAAHYDDFRERLLHGRSRLLELMDFRRGLSLVDLGAGTGRNLESLGPRARELGRVHLVDLCPALLNVARRRFAESNNVRIVEHDAATYDPGCGVDRVLFSYSLSMMPDWQAALGNAVSMLTPGGLLGVVDFRAPPGRLERFLWRTWFSHDGVRIDPGHGPALRALLEPLHCIEARGRMPWLPFRAPYFLFVGRKPSD